MAFALVNVYLDSQFIVFCVITAFLVAQSEGHNPCCSYPCQNRGVCSQTGKHGDDTYDCDCTNTGYYGENCESAYWQTSITNLFVPSQATKLKIVLSYPWMWKIINSYPFLHYRALKYIYFTRGKTVVTPHMYNVNHEYTTSDVYYNRSYYARDLPPIPCDCPTAMGTKGPVVLPSVEEIYERVFRRRRFHPDPIGTNLIFSSYAQHFTHQFFKTDYKRGHGFTYGDEGVDLSQVYGKDEPTRRALRSFKKGKLKTRLLDGEEYPPFQEDAPEVFMNYPQVTRPNPPTPYLFSSVPPQPMWAMGHQSFGRTHMLFIISTMWVREHNRVCDILAHENPTWDDEHIYQTGRLILTGEMLTITMSEYVQHLSQYLVDLRYIPELTHDMHFQYANRIRSEFVLLYYWHQFMPDTLQVHDTVYNISTTLYTNNAGVFEHGIDDYVGALVNTIAGKLTFLNDGLATATITKMGIQEGRDIRLRSFNEYRRRFGLPVYETFEELTGETEMAQVLRELYEDVDAVEFFVGMTVEKHFGAVTPPSMIAMGGPWAIKGIMGNPIGSPDWWKPSVFGGQVGFEIVKNATLSNLFCKNLRKKCKGYNVSFRVSDEVLEKAMEDYHKGDSTQKSF